MAVLVEDATSPRGEISGGGLAGPIAEAVMQAVLGPDDVRTSDGDPTGRARATAMSA